MPFVHFITHPEVVIDPSAPMPDWPLSKAGAQRMRLAVERTWVAGVRSVFCSAERKAREAADVLAERLRTSPIVVKELGENDRSTTGYLRKDEFETVADLFFARPNESVRGWERAVDAQRRIIGAIEQVISAAPMTGDIAIVSHGGVGALLLCHIKGVPISREEDQPGSGGGNTYSFDKETRRLCSGWRSIEG